MAIYHCSVKIISRSSGRSATGAAAYRSAEKITDERTGLVHDYTRKSGVDHSEILAPENSPAWVHDRTELWNQVEQIEKRKDAQLCREVELALPRELNLNEMQELVRGYTQNEFINKGMIADINIHHANGENPHAHILLTTREITQDGFGKKNRAWNKKEHLHQWRQSWEQHANHALEKSGHEQRIDHRTLKAQGIDRIPQIHLGAKVIEMEFRGQRTERGTKALTIEKANAKIINLQTYREALEHERIIEIEKSERRRRVSDRDRTVSASNGDLSGQDRTNDRRTTNSEFTPSGTMDKSAGRNRSGMEVMGGTREASGRGIDHGQQFSQESRNGLAVEDMARNDDRFDDAYASATDRIMDLARPNDFYQRQRSSDSMDGAKKPLDRTYLAAKRQMQAMGCNTFDVGIRSSEGRMMTRTWSTQETLKSITWLKRENAKGSDIYIRPSGNKNQGIILVDDLNGKSLEHMKNQGLAPAVVVETSPMNYQAWVRLTQNELEPDVASTASQAICRYFEADLNSADWRHFGRFAGFTNRKPEHVTETGRNPWVLCHEANGKQARRGEEMASKAKQAYEKSMAEQKREYRLEALKNAPERVYGDNPSNEYLRQLKRLTERYGANLDISKADYMICTDMAKKNYTPEQLQKTLEAHSPELPTRKASHEQDYCQRTVKAAFANTEVQAHLRKTLERQKNRDHDRGYDLSL